jgi:hypothetical protein
MVMAYQLAEAKVKLLMKLMNINCALWCADKITDEQFERKMDSYANLFKPGYPNQLAASARVSLIQYTIKQRLDWLDGKQ